jgi:hypothetical protein
VINQVGGYDARNGLDPAKTGDLLVRGPRLKREDHATGLGMLLVDLYAGQFDESFGHLREARGVRSNDDAGVTHDLSRVWAGGGSCVLPGTANPRPSREG